MDSITVGTKVTTPIRRSTGTVLRHHPTLPAWVVRFAEDPTPLAWYYDRPYLAA